MTATSYSILWEYDRPVKSELLTGYSPNVWYYKTAPGLVTITDDYSVTGYYEDNNVTYLNVQSLKTDGIFYSKVSSIAECESTKTSFYFDYSNQNLYIHFYEDKSPYYFRDILLGATVGFSLYNQGQYFNNIYYEPRIDKIFSIKKSKDPLFYGVLKYTTGNVKCFNNDGYFDDWRERDLFAQASRILVGQGTNYDDYENVFSGLIENDSRSWDDFSVKLQDPRKGLTQPIARNLLNQADYPYLAEGNIDVPKPVKYGIQKNSPCICLNEDQTGTTTFTFLLCDTEFNAVSYLTAVYVDGVATSPAGSDLNAGTFTLTMTAGTDQGNVTADFIASDIVNGVDIIKDLMLNYDDKTYTSTFWNTSEVDAAETLARDTSVSIDDDTKLIDVIEQICIDIDAIFFSQNDGKYTIRIYDEDRAITKIIRPDEWLGVPDIDNNGSEFLSSVIIQYSRDINEDDYLQYENRDYEEEVFDTYRKLKSTTYTTNLTTLTDAQEKSETIMSISKCVGDIISRSIPYTNDIEIMDFIVGSPDTRYSETPNYRVFEVIGITQDFTKDILETKLELRYVKDYDMPIDVDYGVLVDESGVFIIDEIGNTIITR